jgi:hypothetical protein
VIVAVPLACGKYFAGGIDRDCLVGIDVAADGLDPAVAAHERRVFRKSDRSPAGESAKCPVQWPPVAKLSPLCNV